MSHPTTSLRKRIQPSLVELTALRAVQQSFQSVSAFGAQIHDRPVTANSLLVFLQTIGVASSMRVPSIRCRHSITSALLSHSSWRHDHRTATAVDHDHMTRLDSRINVVWASRTMDTIELTTEAPQMSLRGNVNRLKDIVTINDTICY